jgi:protocatechuate 3,4-dioxygenase beta subunit
MRLVLVLFCSGLLLAQTASTPQDQCRVEGKVVNSLTGEPLRQARVTLRLNPAAPAPGAGGVGAAPQMGTTAGYTMMTGGSPALAAANASGPSMPSLPTLSSGAPRPSPITVATDADGKFAFVGVNPGDYQIAARRDNFQYIAPRRPEPVSLKAGESKRDIVLKLTPLGVIEGLVRDENGEPVQNVPVSLMTWQYSPSGRQLTTRASTTTNDLGRYRLFGVAAGKYYLKTSAPSRRMTDEDETFVPSFYPAALDAAGAAVIEIHPGEEIRGIDLTARRARTVVARGRLVRPEGAATVIFTISQSLDNGSMNSQSPLGDPEGKFELRGMMPGAYTLGAQTTVADRRFSVSYPLQVGSEDIDNLELRLEPALELKGLVRIEGSTAIKPSQVSVRLDGRLGRSAAPMLDRIMTPDGRMVVSSGGAVAEDGTFTRTVDPDFYRVSATAPDPLYLKSATCGSRDVTETGIDLSGGGACLLTVVMSADGGQIEGLVMDADSQPAASAQVTLAPAGSLRADLLKSATTDVKGRFKISAVVPGSYKIYAWEEVDINAVRYDPEFVKPYESSAQSVKFAEGSKASLTLKQIPKPQDR